jgi:hypothetical protein
MPAIHRYWSARLVFLVQWDHLVGHEWIHGRPARAFDTPRTIKPLCTRRLATTARRVEQWRYLRSTFCVYMAKHVAGCLQRLPASQDAVFHKEQSSRTSLYATTVTRTMRIVTAFGVGCRRTAKMRLMSWFLMFWAASPKSLSSSLGQRKL